MSLGLTVASLTLAILVTPLYLVGLFHLPQALVAVAASACARAR